MEPVNETYIFEPQPVDLRLYYVKVITSLRPSLLCNSSDDTNTNKDNFIEYIWRPYKRYSRLFPVQPESFSLAWMSLDQQQQQQQQHFSFSFSCTDTFLLYNIAKTRTHDLFHIRCASHIESDQGAIVDVSRVSLSVIQRCLQILLYAGQEETDHCILFCLVFWPFVLNPTGTPALERCPKGWWEEWCVQRALLDPTLSSADQFAIMTSLWTPLNVSVALQHKAFPVTNPQMYIKGLQQLRTLLPAQSILRVRWDELESLAVWWGWWDAHHIGIVYAVAYDQGIQYPAGLSVYTTPDHISRSTNTQQGQHRQHQHQHQHQNPHSTTQKSSSKTCCTLHKSLNTSIDKIRPQSARLSSYQSNLNKFFFSLVFYVDDPNIWAPLKDIQLFSHRQLLSQLYSTGTNRSTWYIGCFDPLRMAYCIPKHTPVSLDTLSIKLYLSHSRCPQQL